MLLTALVHVPFLFASYACASSANAPSSHSLGLFSIFQAYKTGVLRVRQEDIDDGWLQYYQLFPTNASVDRIDRLLLRDSVHLASHYRSEKVASPQSVLASASAGDPFSSPGHDRVRTPQNVLVVALRRKGSGEGQYHVMKFLAEYVIFKAMLYEGLSKEEADILMSISEEILCPKYLSEIRILVSNLTSLKCRIQLFTALVCSINVYVVGDALSTLTDRRPEIIIKLVREYIESCSSDSIIVIPADFFSRLPVKSQYDLLRVKFFTWQPGFVYTHGLYILSRFSESPSEEIRELCLKSRPGYQIYEQAAQQVKDSLLIRMERLNPEMIPKEIWINILAYCDNFLFQIYTVPLVCKFWNGLHQDLLSHSPTLQKAFISDWRNALTARQASNYRQYPWNCFLRSPLDFFTYTLTCLESFPPGISDRRMKERIKSNWQQFAQQISRGERPMASASYLGLYVQCCKILERPLELYRPLGISDEDYLALIKELVNLHKIVPVIPDMFFLCEECRRSAQILEYDDNLDTVLLQSGLQCYGRLSVYRFWTQAYIPPRVGQILCRASELCHLLANENGSARRHPSDTLQSPAESSIADILANRAELERNILAHRPDQNCMDYVEDPELTLPLKRELDLATMTLLCKNCRDYSEEDFCAVHQVLELCEIFDQDSKSFTLRHCTASLLNDPKITIELVC